MKFNPIITLFNLILLISCQNEKEDTYDLEGKWRAEIDLSEDVLPFGLEINQSGEKWSAFLINGEEKLEIQDITVQKDSIHIPMGVFDATIHARIHESGELVGKYVRNYSVDYILPFQASKTEAQRFPTNKAAEVNFSGRWKTVFQDKDGKTYDAIGIFEQEGNLITGTFLTALGDYRFLEGNVDGNQFYLSAFDGSHLFFFQGQALEDGSIQGRFRSGPRYKETFIAIRDEDFELPDPGSLTYLKEGYETLDFKFPDTEGNPVSLGDDRFQNKVVLVQLFGSWCPNCMDETKYLAPWYEQNKDRGVEIVGLAFESKPDFDYASKRVKNAAEKLGANYPFLIAGESNKDKASQALPALNRVVAFPTLIYLDRKGKVRHIHTGFNGPGTGGMYDRWIEEHEELVNGLLGEKL
ncbi:peroxiredoxin family protein [Belliella kenyensis]|uniref:Peroxiredoxin family protein n=1 Tax=Belliella kenyensis TaxID=1472724 RepID=A0ABV8EQL4_9BACT|nr:TlpA disulfide reductase family protein [Belliella kenyensis]MCH7403826.1 TlpA family protein disulfide reductase [Belliella kenyensis]MDN3602462.1 TlpA disulfide reductase family protein [Belliella kenyensis]